MGLVSYTLSRKNSLPNVEFPNHRAETKGCYDIWKKSLLCNIKEVCEISSVAACCSKINRQNGVVVLLIEWRSALRKLHWVAISLGERSTFDHTHLRGIFLDQALYELRFYLLREGKVPPKAL